MKNSTLIKGTAAIAVGAALLLGGGGTLAAWNAEATATPGTIVSGDLDVVNATSAGVWKDRAGATINIANYKVVPGDKLTYTQDLTVTLVGDKMAANITTTGITPTNGFTSANVSVTGPALTIGTTPVSNPLTPKGSAQTVTATITFEFLSTTSGRANVDASYNFNNVAFQLQQVVAGSGLVAQS
ncbi:alternate-type signal peptide domain-containing protein [Pseudarthrobacter sp. NamE2]|uniref:alternate-type signal peptide domain-containing protein n=1 Tax=Pseudarthrobacter sp. NamE2 TaxID=2576838 RepID=UPI0010FF16B8|nr:alternate-type signal peptide domain-containing protein [Pseudarthrobacter sp. NamE2]TLM81729.1 alternate-type signal peptide domain-containing protein [Pseudarthrobacter sp. NamE2]